MKAEDQALCQGRGEPEDGIELHCCLPAGHDGKCSLVVVPTPGVMGTATPQDQAIYDGMADQYQRERTPGVGVLDGNTFGGKTPMDRKP